MSLPGPLVAIVGPTASGKSSLAERIACELGTSVVSVDAMQVYRGMDIGTAKVPLQERRCPLLMVDVADVGEDYSVKRFQQDARHCVDRLLGEGKVPILCGGTGLYLNAVIDDMRFPAGELASPWRLALEERLRTEGPEALHALLAERDPRSAELIHPNNTRRVVRALEMLDEGISYAEHHEGLNRRAPVYDALIWAISTDRQELYDRIETRVDRMFEEGLVDEVRRLREMGLERAHTAAQAIGYKEVLMALDGSLSMGKAAEVMKKRTRHYAKRQISWFKHDKRVRWIDAHNQVEAATRIVVDLASHRQEE